MLFHGRMDEYVRIREQWKKGVEQALLNAAAHEQDRSRDVK